MTMTELREVLEVLGKRLQMFGFDCDYQEEGPLERAGLIPCTQARFNCGLESLVLDRGWMGRMEETGGQKAERRLLGLLGRLQQNAPLLDGAAVKRDIERWVQRVRSRPLGNP